jgi:dihydroorotate dehydrogenase electron transfer subunit
MDKRFTLPIAEIIRETDSIKTFVFKHKLAAKPGQFVMLTDFCTGEKPFSISDCSDNHFALTIKKIGNFTTRIFQKSVGDHLSIRGPFGSSFFVSKGRVLLIGGGYGTPPLYFLATQLLKTGAEIILVNGARTKEDLVFCDRFRDLQLKYENITQAGCLGKSGTSVDLAEQYLREYDFDYIYAAGPEMMLKALLPLVKSRNYQFLLERYMKCAIGICGSCAMDPLGIRVCAEGPVLGAEYIDKLSEFGNYHRDAAGRKIMFDKKEEK